MLHFVITVFAPAPAAGCYRLAKYSFHIVIGRFRIPVRAAGDIEAASLENDKWNERPHLPSGKRWRKRTLTGRRHRSAQMEDH